MYNKIKKIALIVGVIALIPVNPIKAGWLDSLKNTAQNFIQKKVIPALYKPETYVMAGAAIAAAALATYCRKDIYWAFRSELPIDRVEAYVGSSLKSVVQARDVAPLQTSIMRSDFFAQLGSNNLIKKHAIIGEMEKHVCEYEFDLNADVPCMGDNLGGEVYVIDHSNFVCQQTGSNCGYHATFNAATLFTLLSRKGNKEDYLNCLKVGPPIEDWKRIVEAYEGVCWAQNVISNPAAPREDSKYSNAVFEDIADAACEHLLQTQYNMTVSAPDSNDITILANPGQKRKFFHNIEEIGAQLRGRTKEVHAFLLGDIKKVEEARSSCGHWIAAVVTAKNDAIKIHVMDSKVERSVKRREVIDRLIEHLGLNGGSVCASSYDTSLS